MASLNLLRGQLAAIQSALAEDALECLPPLVERYHLHLNAWMATGIGNADAAIEQMRELHRMHHQVMARMQQCQQRLHVRMQAERHGSRAARAYLSGTA